MFTASGRPTFYSTSVRHVQIKNNDWRDRAPAGRIKVRTVKANPSAALPREQRIARLRASVVTR